MNIVIEKAYEVFDLYHGRKTGRGWILTKQPCPFCGKDDYHFGIKINPEDSKYKNKIVFNCFKCQEHGTEWGLFKELDMMDVVQSTQYVKQGPQIELENKLRTNKKTEVLELEVPTTRPPLGYKRVYQDDYLDSRGFEPWQYEVYNVGHARLVSKLKDYIIILVEEGGENKGYLARHKWSKERIKEHKSNTGYDIARYRNEGGIDFSKLLFGIDEITEEVDTAILVEGGFDKFNVDKELQLNEDPNIVCLATFGKKLSIEQIEKLKLSGITKIFLMYDGDAVKESKEYSDILNKTFKKVRVCYIDPKLNQDPGDFEYEVLIDLLLKAQSPINFGNTKLQKRKLI